MQGEVWEASLGCVGTFMACLGDAPPPDLPTALPAPTQLFSVPGSVSAPRNTPAWAYFPLPCAFDVMSKKALTTPRSKGRTSVFSSRRFIVLDLTSSFMIHLELVFVYHRKKGV